MTTSVFLQLEDLFPEMPNISFKLTPVIMVVGMLALFPTIGYVFRVADAEGIWATGQSVSNIEDGMTAGADWVPTASYLGLTGLVALSGFYGLAFTIGWMVGYFTLLIFLAVQTRQLGKYTASDFVGDRFDSGTARAIGALTAVFIGFVYPIGQAHGMGLVGLYIFGTDYITMVTVVMAITVDYLTVFGMMGTTKNMTVQHVILTIAFLTAIYVAGFTDSYSTVLPHIEYGQLIDELSTEFFEPSASAGFYLWIVMTFSFIFSTRGLPHVLVQFYAIENEKTMRQSTVQKLFSTLLPYWDAPTLAVFGIDLYSASQYGPTFVADGGMSGDESGLIVVLAAQLPNLPTWFVSLIATGGIATIAATTVELFATASSAIPHDIYTNITNPDTAQRQQTFVSRATTVALGIIVTVAVFDPPTLVGEPVALTLSLTAIVLFPMFFPGLWWENTNRQDALTGVNVSLTLWVAAVVNDLVFHLSDLFVEFVPAIGTALVDMPLVLVITIAVSMATDEPSERIKKIVR